MVISPTGCCEPPPSPGKCWSDILTRSERMSSGRQQCQIQFCKTAASFSSCVLFPVPRPSVTVGWITTVFRVTPPLTRVPVTGCAPIYLQRVQRLRRFARNHRSRIFDVCIKQGVWSQKGKRRCRRSLSCRLRSEAPKCTWMAGEADGKASEKVETAKWS